LLNHEAADMIRNVRFTVAQRHLIYPAVRQLDGDGLVPCPDYNVHLRSLSSAACHFGSAMMNIDDRPSNTVMMALRSPTVMYGIGNSPY
jgi:hypothetical protein